MMCILLQRGKLWIIVRHGVNMYHFLDFEKPISILEGRIEEFLSSIKRVSICLSSIKIDTLGNSVAESNDKKFKLF